MLTLDGHVFFRHCAQLPRIFDPILLRWINIKHHMDEKKVPGTYKVSAEITYPFPNFNRASVEV